jgi:carbamoyl-phosphate synthase small subunit
MGLRQKAATLALEDGPVFYGTAFGADKDGFGEACFNTSMSGYQEILTDPSYAGQMVCMTAPQIGNVGVNPSDMESRQAWPGGFIVRELCPSPSNFRSRGSLEEFLIKQGVAGIAGIDTRALTKHLRDFGAKRGVILRGRVPKEEAQKRARLSPPYVGVDWVARVTTPKAYVWDKPLESGIPGVAAPETGLVDRGLKGSGGSGPSRPKGRPGREQRRFHVVALDCGIKYNILRNLVSRGCRVTVVPASTSARAIQSLGPDGVFLSNGPGDPNALPYIVGNVRQLISARLPIFGICLGHQMLTLALGGKMGKLKFGHRGGNQPVGDQATKKVEITSQNHGFATVRGSFKDKGVMLSHIGLNDSVIEGLSHRTLPIFSVQYHPEASPGPHDANYLFGRFMALMAAKKEKRA